MYSLLPFGGDSCGLRNVEPSTFVPFVPNFLFLALLFYTYLVTLYKVTSGLILRPQLSIPYLMTADWLSGATTTLELVSQSALTFISALRVLVVLAHHVAKFCVVGLPAASSAIAGKTTGLVKQSLVEGLRALGTGCTAAVFVACVPWMIVRIVLLCARAWGPVGMMVMCLLVADREEMGRPDLRMVRYSAYKRGGNKTRKWTQVEQHQSTSSQPTVAQLIAGCRLPMPSLVAPAGFIQWTAMGKTHSMRYFDQPCEYNCAVVALFVIARSAGLHWAQLAYMFYQSGVDMLCDGLTMEEITRVLEKWPRRSVQGHTGSIGVAMNVVSVSMGEEVVHHTLGSGPVLQVPEILVFFDVGCEGMLNIKRSGVDRWVVDGEPTGHVVAAWHYQERRSQAADFAYEDRVDVSDAGESVDAYVTTGEIADVQVAALHLAHHDAGPRTQASLSDTSVATVSGSYSGIRATGNGGFSRTPNTSEVVLRTRASAESIQVSHISMICKWEPQEGPEFGPQLPEGYMPLGSLNAAVLTRESCPYAEMEDGSIALIRNTRNFDEEIMFGDFVVDCGCVLSPSVEILGKKRGIGQRKWWFTGRPTTFVGCGPVRPDTLFKIQRPNFRSKYCHTCPYTVMAPALPQYVPTAMGLEKEKARTELQWTPISDGRWTYTFHKTGRCTLHEGSLWLEFQPVRTAATIVSHVGFTDHARPAFECVNVVKRVDQRDVIFRRWVIAGEVFEMPVRLYELAKKVALTTKDDATTTMGLTSIFSTPSSDCPGFILNASQMACWRDYFVLTYGRSRHTMDLRSLQCRFSAGKKSRGLAVAGRVGPDRQCCKCRGWAPVKFHWRHGLCPDCDGQLRSGINNEELSTMYADPELPFPADTGVHHLTEFPHMVEKVAKEKRKQPRPQALFNVSKARLKGKDIGFSRPSRHRLYRAAKPVLVGVGFATRVGVFESTAETEDVALRTRLFAEPVTGPAAGAFEDLWRFTKAWGLIGPPATCGGEVFCYVQDYPEGWQRNPKFLPALRAYANLTGYVVDGLRTKSGNSWISTFPPARRAQFWRTLLEGDPGRIGFNFFLKRELAALAVRWNRDAADCVNPRIICSPHDWSHIVMGPRLRKLTSRLHGVWRVDHFVTYAGGLQPAEMHDWACRQFSGDCMSFTRPGVVAIENDFAKFDCTYSQSALNYVSKVYDHWGFNVHQEPFRSIWRQWARPAGVMKSSGRKVNGPTMNASGRDDTALMNALLNGVIQSYAFASILLNNPHPENATPLEIAWVKNKVSLIVLGDDSLTITPTLTKQGSRWKHHEIGDVIAKFGFEARDMAVRHKPCQCVFLGCRPYPAEFSGPNSTTVVEPTWGPTIGRRIIRVSTLLDPGSKDPFAWLKGITTSALVSYPHVPYLNDLMRTMEGLNLSRQCTPVEDERDKHKRMMFLGGARESRLVDAVMLEVYGVTRMEHLFFKAQLAQVQSLPCVIVNPTIEKMVSCDT